MSTPDDSDGNARRPDAKMPLAPTAYRPPRGKRQPMALPLLEAREANEEQEAPAPPAPGAEPSLYDQILQVTPRRPPVLLSPADRLASRLRKRFGTPAREGRAGWHFFTERSAFPPDEPEACEPNIVGWLSETAPPHFASLLEPPPDWACELRSGSDSLAPRNAKLAGYLSLKIKHLWFVDREQQLIEVYALRGDYYVRVHVSKAAESIQAAPFEAEAIPLAKIWPGQNLRPRRIIKKAQRTTEEAPSGVTITTRKEGGEAGRTAKDGGDAGKGPAGK